MESATKSKDKPKAEGKEISNEDFQARADKIESTHLAKVKSQIIKKNVTLSLVDKKSE